MKRFFITGKGGVGKSTISAALALALSRQASTLIISLDPTRSLTTIFRTPITDRDTPIEQNLFAKEVDPALYSRKFKETLLQRLSGLKLNIAFSVEEYLNAVLSNPSVQEEVLVEYIMKEIIRRDYQYLVFDMAPTASFYKTFTLLLTLQNWIKFLRKQREKIAQMAEVVNQKKDDPLLKELEDLYGKFKELHSVLTGNDSRFFIVCNPGIVSAKETLAQINFYRNLNLPLSGVILNKCDRDIQWWEILSDFGVSFESGVVKAYPQWVLPQLPEEPVGLASLERLTVRLSRFLEKVNLI